MPRNVNNATKIRNVKHFKLTVVLVRAKQLLSQYNTVKYTAVLIYYSTWNFNFILANYETKYTYKTVADGTTWYTAQCTWGEGRSFIHFVQDRVQ
jgi:hypothetical protein